jgi:polysaccharide biosynthesis/export protein
MYKGERFFNNHIVICVMLLCALLVSSCKLGKKVPYFTDIPDSTGHPLVQRKLVYSEPTIKVNDILGITIQTMDQVGAASFNSGASEGASTTTQGIGYLVDNKGEVELPLMGRLKVAGLTTIQARELIRDSATHYFVNPAVNVRFLNYVVTVLGDVGNPGTYTVQSERISILDALGMAGDLSISAKRENIMLIREENGEKIFMRVNLNSSDLVSSPYFYLRTGDVLIAEPNKAKAKSATLDATRDKYIAYALSSVSIIISVVTLVRLLNN